MRLHSFKTLSAVTGHKLSVLRFHTVKAGGPRIAAAAGSEEVGLRPEGFQYIEEQRQRIISDDKEYMDDEDFSEPTLGGDSLLGQARSRAFLEVDETDPVRFPYHKSLAVAAKAGNGQNAYIVLQAMAGKGLTPGPKAWHAVICAHVKDPSMTPAQALGATMEAASRAFRAGIRLDQASYLVLIAANLKCGRLREAVLLHSHMERHEVPTGDAWNLLARTLFTSEHAEALDFYRVGAAKGHLPSADLLEYALRAMLSDTGAVRGTVAEAEAEIERFSRLNKASLNTAGLKLEARHVNLLLRSLCREAGMAEKAQKYLEDMKAGMYGLPRPDASTLEMMAEGVATSSKRGAQDKQGPRASGSSTDPDDDDVSEQLHVITALLAEYGLRPSPRYHALMVGNYLHADSLDQAFESYLKMRAAGFGRSAPSMLLPEKTLLSLVQRLSEAGRPYDVLRVLMAMARDGRTLAFREWPASTTQGRSHLTHWIGRVPQTAGSGTSEGSSRVVPGGIQAALEDLKRKKEQEEAEEVLNINGITIGKGKCVVDSNGNVVSLSKMNSSMLLAELEAKGIDASGMKRKDMYKKVQTLRKEDTSLLEISKRLKKEREKEEKRRRLMKILTPEQRLEEERKRREEERKAKAAEGGEEEEDEDEEEEESAGSANRRLRVSYTQGLTAPPKSADILPPRNQKQVGSRSVAVPVEVTQSLEAKRRIQQTFAGDEDFRKALSGEAGEEDAQHAGASSIPGGDDDVLDEKSRAAGGDADADALPLSEDDEDAIRMDMRGTSDWLNIGTHMSNNEGGLDHAYNILNASAKLGVRPRVSDWEALLRAIETTQPAYPRAAFYALRKLDRLTVDALYTVEETEPLIERAAQLISSAALTARAAYETKKISVEGETQKALDDMMQGGEAYAHIVRSGVSGVSPRTLAALKEVYAYLVHIRKTPADVALLKGVASLEDAGTVGVFRRGASFDTSSTAGRGQSEGPDDEDTSHGVSAGFSEGRARRGLTARGEEVPDGMDVVDSEAGDVGGEDR